jgi:glycosyltransferase involved in cell wall biosynthesis
MTDNRPSNHHRLDALRQLETLQEYEFASPAPWVSRLRSAWNSVATKWQARLMMDQQSTFNRALVDWLERPPGQAGADDLFPRSDRQQTRLAREVKWLSGIVGRWGDKHPGDRLSIAYFSPLPPSRSGIADYSAELLPYLAELADVTVFSDGPATLELPGIAIRPISEFPQSHADYALPLYQMGNSDQHEALYAMLLRYPGVVVLHDYFLHHFIQHRTVGRGDWAGYSREMGYALGAVGRRMVREVESGAVEAPLFHLPLNQRVLDSALGLIVHSRFAAERARQYRPDLPLAIVPAVVEMRAGRSLRERLELPEKAVLFGSFGQITTEKRINASLGAFRHLLRRFPEAHFLLVGDVQPDVDLPALVTRLELDHAVHHIGYVHVLDEFINWIHTVDVVVNLRLPTVGETSAVALRALAAARPLIVYDHGWYSELPERAAVKVAPGDATALHEAMETLAQSAALRQSMGKAGYEYARDFCSPSLVAADYIDFVRAVVEPVYG